MLSDSEIQDICDRNAMRNWEGKLCKAQEAATHLEVAEWLFDECLNPAHIIRWDVSRHGVRIGARYLCLTCMSWAINKLSEGKMPKEE